jgi:hypothetical protein
MGTISNEQRSMGINPGNVTRMGINNNNKTSKKSATE